MFHKVFNPWSLWLNEVKEFSLYFYCFMVEDDSVVEDDEEGNIIKLLINNYAREDKFYEGKIPDDLWDVNSCELISIVENRYFTATYFDHDGNEQQCYFVLAQSLSDGKGKYILQST